MEDSDFLGFLTVLAIIMMIAYPPLFGVFLAIIGCKLVWALCNFVLSPFAKWHQNNKAVIEAAIGVQK